MAKILLLDDDKRVRDRMAYVLTQDGHQVTDIDQNREALALLQFQPFDLLIEDIERVGLDGFNFLEHIRTLGYNLPVICCFAHLASYVLERTTGFSAVIEHPFDPDELNATVSRVIFKEMPLII